MSDKQNYAQISQNELQPNRQQVLKILKEIHLGNSVNGNLLHCSRFQEFRNNSIIFVKICCTGLLQNRIKSEENVR